MGVIGIRISNTEPLLGPEVSELMQFRSPPIFLASPFATSRPRPNPSFWRVNESSSLENGLKRYGRNVCGMPGPVSAIVTTIYRGFGLSLAATVILPHSVNFSAFRKTHEINFVRSRSSTD